MRKINFLFILLLSFGFTISTKAQTPVQKQQFYDDYKKAVEDKTAIIKSDPDLYQKALKSGWFDQVALGLKNAEDFKLGNNFGPTGNFKNGGGATCETKDPFCTAEGSTYPAGVNTGTAQSGPAYGCLGSTPNPIWYYMKVATAGDIHITETNSANKDVDFILWGPFSSLDVCGSLTSAKIIDCSYSTSAVEYIDISTSQVGEYYILLITNFSNQPTNITLAKTSGSGTTDCSILIPDPVVSTTSITAITSNSASSGGNVTNDSGLPITARGVCWNTTGNPTISDNHTSDGAGLGAFTSSITGLTPGMTYYVRAYATNSNSTGYGQQISFTTQSKPVGLPATNITTNSFTANWSAFSGAISYVIDVATDAGFTTFVTGYQALNVGNVITYNIINLPTNTYYYRVRAITATLTTENSNIISLATKIAGDINGDGIITAPEIAGDTNGDGIITAPEIAGDTNGDGIITAPEIAGDVNGDGVITAPEIAGDVNGDGVITAPEIAGDVNGDGIINNGEIAGDINGDKIINNGEICGDINGDKIINNGEIGGDSSGNKVITSPEIAGDANGDGVITAPEIAGDVNCDGIITAPEIAGDINGNGVITAPEIAGDINGDKIINNGEICGDINGDKIINNGEIGGDASGNKVITTPEIAGDANGNGVITALEIAGDINCDGIITFPEIAGDINGDKQITGTEIAGDVNGDKIINNSEIAGDINGDKIITGTEVAGDINGDRSITGTEIAGDINGDRTITGTEIAGDINGDKIINNGEICGDINGDKIINNGEIGGDASGNKVITTPEIAGDANGNGVITAPEIAGDINCDGIITFPEIAGDINGNGVITAPEIAGDINGDRTITGTEIAGDIDGNRVINYPSEIAGDVNGNRVINFPTEIAGDINGNGTIVSPELTGDVNGNKIIALPELLGDSNGNLILETPNVVNATDASNLATTSFTANWNLVSGAIPAWGYKIDVSTDAQFTNILSSYNNVDAGTSGSFNISGLNSNTHYYYYRIRAFNEGVSANSNIIEVVTTILAKDISKGFSPNGDGINDVFMINNLAIYPNNSLIIINRWGNKVFEASPYNNDWKGTNHFGISLGNEDLPEGTYFYIFDFGNGAGLIKGHVYIKRK